MSNKGGLSIDGKTEYNFYPLDSSLLSCLNNTPSNCPTVSSTLSSVDSLRCRLSGKNNFFDEQDSFIAYFSSPTSLASRRTTLNDTDMPANNNELSIADTQPENSSGAPVLETLDMQTRNNESNDIDNLIYIIDQCRLDIFAKKNIPANQELSQDNSLHASTNKSAPLCVSPKYQGSIPSAPKPKYKSAYKSRLKTKQFGKKYLKTLRAGRFFTTRNLKKCSRNDKIKDFVPTNNNDEFVNIFDSNKIETPAMKEIDALVNNIDELNPSAPNPDLNINGIKHFDQLETPEVTISSSNKNTTSNVQAVSPSMINCIRKQILQTYEILLSSPSFSSMLACSPTTLNNIYASSNDIHSNSIDMQSVSNAYVSTFDKASMQANDLRNIEMPTNNNDVPAINERNLSTPNSEDEQNSNLVAPTGHHQSLMENVTAKEIKTKINVNGLHRNMTDEELENICKEFGKIVKIIILKDKSNKCRGNGSVEFETPEEAKNAIPGLKRKNINASFARKRGPKTNNKPFELKKTIRKEINRRSQTKHRHKRKGQEFLINPANIVRLLNDYVSNIQSEKENILDEEKVIAKKFKKFFSPINLTTSIDLSKIISKMLDDSSMEKENTRSETNRKAQTKNRLKKKGQVAFINPANIVHLLNEYFPNNETIQKILDEEKVIARKFMDALKQGVLIDHRTMNNPKAKKSELIVVATIQQHVAENIFDPK